MPIIGATLTAVGIDATFTILTCDGTNFGDVQYPASNIKCRINGSGNPYTAVDVLDSWGNLQSVGHYNTALPGGSYDVQVITSNNETLTLENAFSVATDIKVQVDLDGETVDLFAINDNGCNSYLVYIDAAKNMRVKYKYMDRTALANNVVFN